MLTTDRFRPALLALAVAAVSGCSSTPAVTSTSSSLDRPTGRYRFKVALKSGTVIPGSSRDVILPGFDLNGINLQGQLLVDTGFQRDQVGEALLVLDGAEVRTIMQTGLAAPGGGNYLFAFTPARFNDWGDVAFTAAVGPPVHPFGVGANVFRFDAVANRTDAVVLAGVTPAPGGGVFRGAAFHAETNDLRQVAFTGIVSTDRGVSGTLGAGVYRRRFDGSIAGVIAPGDAAPGGVFDLAMNASINSVGDAAVAAHLSGEPCIDYGVPQEILINCGTSVYLERSDGTIVSIAHQAAPAPGGGVFQVAWNVRINNRAQVAFFGDLSVLPESLVKEGVFLYEGGRVRPIARPGQAMPGGGRVVTVGGQSIGNLDLNDAGQVAFTATLDSTSAGRLDSAVYLWSQGALRLIAHSGTTLPGVGLLTALVNGPVLNDLGQIAFTASLGDGSDVLIVGTPCAEDEATPTG
jgi:hypothetical protein